MAHSLDLEDKYTFEPFELDQLFRLREHDENMEKSSAQTFDNRSLSDEDTVQDNKDMLLLIKTDPDPNDDAVNSDVDKNTITKVKRKKKTKLPGQPKRPTSAYMLWLNEEGRELIMKENPKCGVTDVAKSAGEMWRELGEGSKKKYEDIHQELIEKYKEDYKEWLESGGREAIKQAKNDRNNMQMKSINKVKKERKVQQFSAEDDKAVNSIMQIDDSGIYICTFSGCNNRWKSKSGMKRHIRTMHLNLISYQCEQCDYVSKFRLSLNEHVSSVHENISIKCGFCDYETKYKSDIYTHMKYVHRNADKLQCHICEFQTTKKYCLDRHIQGMHVKTNLQCDQCSFVTTWKNTLKQHVLTVHNQGIRCELCSFTGAFSYELRKHAFLKHGEGANLTFERNTNGVYPCYQCDYTSSYATNIKSHIYTKHIKEMISTHTPEPKVEIKKEETQSQPPENTALSNLILDYQNKSGKYSCKICDFNAPNKNILDEHHKGVHNGKKIPCPSCDSQFTEKKGLNRHMNAVHLGTKYNCDLCGAQFSEKGGLSKHKRSIHEEKKYLCHECDILFARKDSLTLHIQTVHEQIRFQCTECSYETNRKSSLAQHQRSVHEGKRFNCPDCNCEYAEKGSLTKHQEAVHEEKKYLCSQCSLQFTRKDSLTNHTQTVHEEKKYSCDQCGYLASRKDYLITHQRSVHEGIRYQCSQCNAQFTEKGSLTKHSITVHSCAASTPNDAVVVAAISECDKV